jgi:uncharacterized protein YggE
MTKSSVRSLIGALALTPIMAVAQSPVAPAPAVSEVHSSGFATISVAADLAVVTIQFSAAGRTPAIAGRLASTRANAIRAAIIALGIPKDSLPTSGRWGRWGGWGGGRSEVQVRNEMRDTSYVTNDVFQVRIHDLTLIGRVIDTALAAGAQTISNVEFRATNTEAATLDAIRQATIMARARAQAVAEASGMRLGRAIQISTDGPGMQLSSTGGASDGAMFRMAAESSTTVVTPELKVVANVSGRWEMLPGAR